MEPVTVTEAIRALHPEAAVRSVGQGYFEVTRPDEGITHVIGYGDSAEEAVYSAYRFEGKLRPRLDDGQGRLFS